MEIRARVAGRARRAGAPVEDRPGVGAGRRLDQVEPPAGSRVGHECYSMASEASGDGAIEGVDAEADARDQVVDVADPQQVARALGSQTLELGGRPRDDLVHLRLVTPE